MEMIFDIKQEQKTDGGTVVMTAEKSGELIRCENCKYARIDEGRAGMYRCTYSRLYMILFEEKHYCGFAERPEAESKEE